MSSGSSFEDLERLDAREATVGILVEEGVEHGAGSSRRTWPKTFRFFTLAARSRRVSGLVEGYVADEVEGVVVPSHLLGKFVEEEPLVP